MKIITATEDFTTAVLPDLPDGTPFIIPILAFVAIAVVFLTIFLFDKGILPPAAVGGIAVLALVGIFALAVSASNEQRTASEARHAERAAVVVDLVASDHQSTISADDASHILSPYGRTVTVIKDGELFDLSVKHLPENRIAVIARPSE